MTLVKFNSDTTTPRFSSWLDRFFDDFDQSLKFNSKNLNAPAVNVLENEKSFLLEVAAPGLNKRDFNIDVEDGILTISHSKETKKEEEVKENYTRKEFNYSQFKRSFTLPENVDEKKIEAKYQEGVLHLEIPKVKEAAKTKKVIEIS